MNSPEDVVEATIDGQLVLMPHSMAELHNQPPIRLSVDGKSVEVPRVSVTPDPKGKAIPRLTTLYDAALQAGVQIPILCHREYMNPVAVCRVCSVHVAYEDPKRPAEGRFAPACYRPAEQGMKISTHHTNERVRSSVRMLTELLLADHPTPCAKHQENDDCELEVLANELGVAAGRLPRAPARRPQDGSSLVIAVDHNACILCDRCIRGCNDIRDNQVMGRMGKGYRARIAFDLDTLMGDSTCVACGECMVSCPTGALINRSAVKPDIYRGLPQPKPKPERVSADELARHPLFEGVAHPFLRFNEGAVVRRPFKKGDVICNEGEFGATAFYIEQGKVEIFIRAPRKHVKGRKNRRGGDKVNWGPLGLVRHFTTVFVGRGEDNREDDSKTRYIPIDAPVPLPYDQDQVATLEQGDLFGEMTCMSSYPRSATVRAAEDGTVVLEMLRNVLYILQRSKRSREILENKYRQRAIDNHLRAVPIFADHLTDAQFKAVVEYLRNRVELVRVNPGDVIFRQGDPADSFYLVRIGFVKVSQAMPGGEHVLAYLGPGKYFGEIGLLSNIPDVQALAPSGVRTATCAALDHVDLVRIRGKHFRALIKQIPGMRDDLVKVAVERLRSNEDARRQVEGVPLGDFLRQGLMNAQSLLVLDLERCTRCDECTKACDNAHDGVTRLIREGLRFDKYLVTTSCRSCLDPYCMVGCPVGSIRRRSSREIIIEDWCIGCGKCADNCPYGNINMHPFPSDERAADPAHPGRSLPVLHQKATTCDLCYELDGEPSCVYACPHDAAFRMSGDELLRQVQGARGGDAPRQQTQTPAVTRGGPRPQS